MILSWLMYFRNSLFFDTSTYIQNPLIFGCVYSFSLCRTVVEMFAVLLFISCYCTWIRKCTVLIVFLVKRRFLFSLLNRRQGTQNWGLYNKEQFRNQVSVLLSLYYIALLKSSIWSPDLLRCRKCFIYRKQQMKYAPLSLFLSNILNVDVFFNSEMCFYIKKNMYFSISFKMRELNRLRWQIKRYL